ncbi:MAG: hypothetical protein GY711_20580 [bacterium]|nr:hypothetical protein [bacterium]
MRSTLAAVSTAVVSIMLSVPAPAVQNTRDARYATVESGAKVRNYADRQGLVVHELDAGSIVRLFGEPIGIGFVECESPSGYPVWVYGEYLQETDVPGVMRVTGSGVNMRPRPELTVANMPLGTKLQRGDRVELIKRQNSSGSLATDWVQVWSPARVRGWILATETKPIADQAQAVAGWNQTLRKLPTKKVVEPGPATVKPESPKPSATKPQASPKISSEAARALKDADALFAAATENLASVPADFDPVLAAYTRVVELAPANTTTADLAQRRLDETRAHAGMARLREEVASSERRLQNRLTELTAEQSKVELQQTAHWGRFHGRGRVESETEAGERRFYLRWAGARETEIACTSGRYDLTLLDGVEIGVMGHSLRQALPATIDHAAEPKLLDLYRIEVISAAAQSPR